MIKDIITTLSAFGLLVFCIIGLVIIGFTWYCKGQTAIVQELCTRQQYDFCEVVKTETEYKLRSLRNDN